MRKVYRSLLWEILLTFCYWLYMFVLFASENILPPVITVFISELGGEWGLYPFIVITYSLLVSMLIYKKAILDDILKILTFIASSMVINLICRSILLKQGFALGMKWIFGSAVAYTVLVTLIAAFMIIIVNVKKHKNTKIEKA